jgi:hypothetical protein
VTWTRSSRGALCIASSTQIDVPFSNSLIEAWWRSLKHPWLFLHPLDHIATVNRLVEFYVTEHHERIPPAAFEGQTPDEVYFGRGAHIPGELAARRRDARGTATVRWRARPARAGRHRRAKTSPHEPYDGFREKLERNEIASHRLPNVRRASAVVTYRTACFPNGSTTAYSHSRQRTGCGETIRSFDTHRFGGRTNFARGLRFQPQRLGTLGGRTGRCLEVPRSEGRCGEDVGVVRAENAGLGSG